MTPHEQMTKWDEEGTEYFVSHLTWSSGMGGINDDLYPVVYHGPDWLLLRMHGNEPDMWVNMAHVMNIRFAG